MGQSQTVGSNLSSWIAIFDSVYITIDYSNVLVQGGSQLLQLTTAMQA